MTREYIIKVDEDKKDIMGDCPLVEKPKELVRCDDCGYSFCEGFVHERLYCEKHPELGEIKGDWFCADCWKA